MIPRDTEVCEMDSRGWLGYFLGDTRLSSRTKREKLPVDCMFRLNRELRKMKPVVKYQKRSNPR